MPSGMSNSGLFCFMLHARRESSRVANGLTLFWNTKLAPQMRAATRMRGARMRTSGMPADFMLSSSKCSPRLPNEMRLARSTASGIDLGMTVRLLYQKNLARRSIVKPLPIRLFIHIQRNCMTKMNRQMKNVPAKTSRNSLMM